MILDPGKPDSKLVFSCDFRSRQEIQSRGGLIVASRVGDYIGGSISPTGASGRVTFAGTENLLINATQMTIALRLKTSANGGGPQYCRWLTKMPNAQTDNQFDLMIENTGAGIRPYLTIAATASDTANYAYMTVLLAPSTDYVLHAVYDGGAAAGNRILWYSQGLNVSKAIVGTIPTAMRAGGAKLGIMNCQDGTGNAPWSALGSGIIYKADIYKEAFSAQQVSDDFSNATYSKVFGGPS